MRIIYLILIATLTLSGCGSQLVYKNFNADGIPTTVFDPATRTEYVLPIYPENDFRGIWQEDNNDKPQVVPLSFKTIWINDSGEYECLTTTFSRKSVKSYSTKVDGNTLTVNSLSQAQKTRYNKPNNLYSKFVCSFVNKDKLNYKLFVGNSLDEMEEMREGTYIRVKRN